MLHPTLEDLWHLHLTFKASQIGRKGIFKAATLLGHSMRGLRQGDQWPAQYQDIWPVGESRGRVCTGSNVTQQRGTHELAECKMGWNNPRLLLKAGVLVCQSTPKPCLMLTDTPLIIVCSELLVLQACKAILAVLKVLVRVKSNIYVIQRIQKIKAFLYVTGHV